MQSVKIYEIPFFIHSSSYIDSNVKIGYATKIWHFCHIQNGAKIGNNCVLGQNVYVGPNVVIGNNVKIQNNVSVYDGVILEDDVFIGPSVVFTNVINPRAFIERKNEFKKTIIKEGASIGANATIICGNTIGKYSMVGAGTVVTKDVGEHLIVAGIPARFMGYICRCGIKLEPLRDKLALVCPSCAMEFDFINLTSGKS